MKTYSKTQSEIIARNIKNSIKMKGIKPSRIWKALYISKSQYYKVLSGNVEIGIEFVRKISDYIEVPLENLLEGSDELTEFELNERELARENYRKAKRVIGCYLAIQPKEVLREDLKDLVDYILDVVISID